MNPDTLYSNKKPIGLPNLNLSASATPETSPNSQHEEDDLKQVSGCAEIIGQVPVEKEQKQSIDDNKLIPSYKKNLYLYLEKSGTVLLSNVIHSLVSRLISQTRDNGDGPNDDDGSNENDDGKQRSSMGTLDGVYIPCLQNILGVMFFIRLSWIVGTAGAIYGFLIVLLCCSVTMLTAISMSAIATNGIVPAGGSYFMISRSLGPELGGAVGILFYIGNTLVASMHIVGAVEILITYIAPEIILFSDTITQSNMYNNYRVYGSILLYVVGTLVYFGIKFVNKFAEVALACVLVSILAVFVGVFVNMYGNDQLELCILGNRLLGEVENCTKAPGSELWKLYCSPPNLQLVVEVETSTKACDPYFSKHNVSVIHGIRGLASGVFYENLHPAFMTQGQLISKTFSDDDILPTTILSANNETTQQLYHNQVSLDMTTTFTILVGIFFASFTGFLAGCNNLGKLKDPQKSIPRGIIGAIVTSSIIYLVFVLLFAGTVDNLLLRDKFGQSIGGRLVVSKLAWPNEWIVLIGAIFSSIGAGVQCLSGAPKLLHAIAKDNIIPFLHPFSKCSKNGEPTRALLLTLFFCQCGVLFGNVDDLAPLLSKFFLMCHQFVNLACVHQTILKTPNWRPRYQYYHWSLSLIGLVLTIVVMFMTSWYYSVLAMGLAACLYKYIEYVGAENEWGDGIGGLALSAARLSLLHLEARSVGTSVGTKNWRPQILILVKLNPALIPEERKMFSLVSQLKAGRGLTMVATVLEGEFQNRTDDAAVAKEELTRCMHEEKVQGFCDVLIAGDVRSGISSLIQVAGLSGLKPNTVLLGWSSNWRDKSKEGVFLRTVHQVSAAKMALLVPKGIHSFPNSSDEVSGTIDVWWIIHEGGLLMLLPFLLKQNRTWKSCKMRIFTVAQLEDNCIAMKKDLELFLYALRIDAEVQIVEMLNSDISEYTYERTIQMELRNELIKDFQSRDFRVAIKQMRSVAEELVASDGNVLDKLHRIQVITESHTYQPGSGKTPELKLASAKNSVNAAENLRKLESDKDLDFFAIEMLNTNQRRVDKFHRKPLSIEGHEKNVRRMHTAAKLNEVIFSKSKEAALVIITMPAPPSTISAEMEANYLEYLEAMTEGLQRILMVRGGGREFLSMNSY